MLNLPSSTALSKKLRRQMGDYAYIRYCRNIGIDFDTVFLLMFNKLPRGI